MRLMNLNIKNKDSLFDKTKSQIVEAIDQDKITEVRLNINREYYEFIKKKWRQSMNFSNKNSLKQPGKFHECFQSFENLFNTINAHTLKLVNEEITIWENVSTNKTGAENYLDIMQAFSNKIRKCKPDKECILRLGHASGWRFITGAWPENLKNFKPVVIPKVRSNNYHYQGYNFPKTRRVEEEYQDLLGFIKLTLTE